MQVAHIRSGPAAAGLRIGLLGGSFNPAHVGHRAISLYALKRLGLDEIWWLVSPQNPLKTSRDMATMATRLHQARRVASHRKIRVTGIESQLGTVYTVDTLLALKRRFPATHFVWLMGSDNMRQVTRWYRWADLFALVPVAVFRRPAYAAGRRQGKAAARFDRGWISVREGQKLVTMRPPAWLVLDNPLNAVSATALRHDARSGKKVF